MAEFKPQRLMPLLDLREYTRDSAKNYTCISVIDNLNYEHIWVLGGTLTLQKRANRPTLLKMYLAHKGRDGIDRDGDTAYAFYISIIGLELYDVDHHYTRLTAWIDPNDPEGFYVPRMAKDLINEVDESVPTHNTDADMLEFRVKSMTPEVHRELYQRLRGQRVLITLGAPPTDFDPVACAISGPHRTSF